MQDDFFSRSDAVVAPARSLSKVVPSDTADLPVLPKGVYVGTGGDLMVVAADTPAGTAGVLFRNIASGSLLPVRTRRVLATGTTAADLVALF